MAAALTAAAPAFATGGWSVPFLARPLSEPLLPAPAPLPPPPRLARAANTATGAAGEAASAIASVSSAAPSRDVFS